MPPFRLAIPPRSRGCGIARGGPQPVRAVPAKQAFELANLVGELVGEKRPLATLHRSRVLPPVDGSRDDARKRRKSEKRGDPREGLLGSGPQCLAAQDQGLVGRKVT